MFRIRRISDDTMPLNRREIEAVQALLRSRIPDVPEREVQAIPGRLTDPLGSRLPARLFVADDRTGVVKGFALLSHAPDIGFCLLDFIVTASDLTRSGVGAALYARVRGAARELGSVGLFFECLPDDPEACSDPASARQNASRLRFYERFGARPIIGTAYETPLSPGEKDQPHLIYDDLDRAAPLGRAVGRRIVRAILERKYGHLCSPEYVDAVVASFADDPVAIRPPRYVRADTAPVEDVPRGEALVTVVVNDRHDIHHIRERGYVEAPVRVRSILKGLESALPMELRAPRSYPDSCIRAVHDGALVDYLKTVCATAPLDRSVYPYVFPIRNKARPPKELSVRAGYYCIDTFTPLNRNAWPAARRAVDCTLTAADAVRDGQRVAYALVRPPGHHAERATFGGFCFHRNGAAIRTLDLPTLVVQEGGYRTVSLGSNARAFLRGLAGLPFRKGREG